MPRSWDEVLVAREGWETCLMVARHFSDHYSLHEEQQEYVYRAAMTLGPGDVAVEVGVCNGKTSAILAYCAAKRGFEAHGVDAFILENTPADFRQAMWRLNLPFTLHYALTSPCPVGTLELAPVEWDRPIDLLLIDASHTDPWVSADVAFWTPFVKPEGYAFFHDYDGKESDASPHVDTRRAIERHTADWEMEYYIGGLMVKRRR